MPRESFDISRFDKGTISAVDSTDIPIDANVSSKNVDSYLGVGTVTGIPTTTNIGASGVGNCNKVIDGVLIQDLDSKYTLLTKIADEIKGLSDFYSARSSLGFGSTLATVSLTSGENSTLIPRNKEVHIGRGTTLPPWYVGYRESHLFGGIGLTTFTKFAGTYYNDAFFGGNYTGSANATYTVYITAVSPDKFKWYKDGGGPSAETAVSTSPITLSDGVTVEFGNLTGHGVSDLWEVKVKAKANIISKAAELVPYLDNGVNGELTVTATASGATTPANFVNGSLSRYKICFVYDDLQESPLLFAADVNFAADANYVSIDILIEKSASDSYIAALNPRITALNLYRADSLTGDEIDLGYSRLVATFDLTKLSNYAVSYLADKLYLWTDYPNFPNNRIFSDYLDFYPVGATYEANSGIPETATTTIVNYGLGTVINDSLIVADCFKTELPGAKQMLFKSQQFRYDIFDFVNTNIILPRVPNALASFAGRTFAFDKSTTWRINPDQFYVEEELKGIGCLGQNQILVTVYGIFWADANNVYWYDGSKINPIADAILPTYQAIAQNATAINNVVKVLFDGKRSLVLICTNATVPGDTPTYTYVAWAYSIKLQRWDYHEYSTGNTTAFSGGFMGLSNEAYSSSPDYIRQLLSSNTKLSAEYITGDFTLGDAKIDKHFCHIKTDFASTLGTGDAVFYSFDKGSNYTQLSDTATGAIPIANVKQKTMRVKITLGATNVLKNMTIVYRRLIGLR